MSDKTKPRKPSAVVHLRSQAVIEALLKDNAPFKVILETWINERFPDEVVVSLMNEAKWRINDAAEMVKREADTKTRLMNHSFDEAVAAVKQTYEDKFDFVNEESTKVLQQAVMAFLRQQTWDVLETAAKAEIQAVFDNWKTHIAEHVHETLQTLMNEKITEAVLEGYKLRPAVVFTPK